MTYAEIVAGWFIFVGLFALLGTLFQIAGDHYRHWRVRRQIRRRVRTLLRELNMPDDWYDNGREEYHV